MTTSRPSSDAAARAQRAGESGWALVETLVSAVLLIVVALAIASSLDTASRASGENKQRSVASSLAEQDQERMRGMDPTALSNYHPVNKNVTTPDGGVYTIASRADWIRDSSGALESCTQNTTQADYLRITSTVTSRAVGTDTAPVTSAGIVTPAVGTFGPGLGTFAVEVVDRNNAKVPNMTVTTSGTRVFSDLTNSLGCAVFGYVPIGGYTGTAVANGWVDRDGNATASGSATVSQGNVSTVQLTYDVAGSLAVTLDGPAPTGAKLNVSQPSFVTPHTLTPAITAGQTALPVIGSLFPFKTSPYNAYVGSCADADPTSYTQPVASTLVTPGNPATPLDVHLPRMAVTVTKSGSALTTAANVKITSTVSGCTESFTGPTSATGLLTVPMPYGHYLVCADQAGKKATTGTILSPVKNIVTGGVSATVNITTAPGSC
jgi:Tfp pilus assembly protein PilV